MTHTSQRFCLRWNNHQSNLLSVFDQLLHDESFVDVTLAVEGQLLKAHKMVLSACSPYFQALFVSHPDKHPIVILKDVPFADMRSLLDFMYRGEVSVDQDRLTAFLKVAESLRIKGLTEVNEEKCDLPSIASSLLSNSQQAAPPPAVPPPPPNLHRIHLSQPSSSSSSPSNAKRSAPSPSNFSSYAAHGPPDLLEVNMTEHSQNSPSSFSEEQNVGSPEQICTPDISDETCCVKSEPGDDSLTPGTSFQDCKSPQLKDSSSSRSQSQTPTNQSERFPPADLPLLRLVPKSELMASYRKDSSSGAGSSKTESNENNNNNSNSSNLNNNNNFLLNSTSPHFMLNNEMKFSPPPHLLSPQSNTFGNSNAASSSGECFSGTPPAKPAPTRRRVRRRATSSSDPAEQLTEMSVRGLNLFRYACIDDGVYKCLECAKTDIVKTFKNKYSFQRHAFLYHEGCQRKVFPCPVCGKEFSRPDKMKNHMKTVHDCFMPKECMVPKEILFPPPPPIPFFLSPP